MIKGLPVRSIAGALADAAASWRDPSFAARASAALAVSGRTGYSLPVVEYAFDCLFGEIDQTALLEVIAGELGSPDVLDRFVKLPGRGRVRAYPAGKVCVLSSRTTIGVALLPAVFALCAKCEVLVKDREDALVAAFFSTLADLCPALGEAASAHAWPGAESDFAGVETIVAFGDTTTLDRVRADAGSRRVIGYGPKAGAGYISRDAFKATDPKAIARAAARDLLLYDSEGCQSLHVLFLQRGGALSSNAFCELLEHALIAVAEELALPPAHLRAEAALAMARERERFRNGAASFGDRRTGNLILLDPPLEEPPLFQPRALCVHSVDAPSDAIAYLQRHGIDIEALAVAGDGGGLVDLAESIGASRITSFGSMQAPPLHTFHGGRPRIAEFVRWIGDET